MSEHRVAGASFPDPFTKTARFTTTAASTGSSSVWSTAHHVNVGRNTLPKQVRVQAPATMEATTATPPTQGDGAREKTQVFLVLFQMLSPF